MRRINSDKSDYSVRKILRSICKPIIFVSILCSTVTFAQVQTEWVNIYNGTGTGIYYSAKNAIDRNGNLIVGGNCFVSSSEDFLVLKYSSLGEFLWSRRYDQGPHSSERLVDMVLDDSCNIYVTGNVNEGQSLGYYNWQTIKLSPDGVIIWVRTLDWTLHKEDHAFGMTLDKERNVFVAGYVQAPPDGITNFDMLLAKYDKDGNLLWTRTHDSPPFHSDWGYGVVTDDSNCAYISGYSSPSKIITIKYDSNGKEKWLKEYNRMSSEYTPPLYSVIDRELNILVNGYYDYFDQANFVTLKYDRNGNLLWDRIFDSPVGAIDIASALAVDSNSNVYVTGHTQSQSNSHDVLIVKYNSLGDTVFIKSYDSGNSQYDDGQAISIDKDGNAYVTGRTNSIYSSYDCLTLKLNATGVIEWAKIFSTAMSEGAGAIKLDVDHNVYITGSTSITSSIQSVLSIKYSQLTGVNSVPGIAEDYEISNYPNPFNPITKIQYQLQASSRVKLAVYNSLGSEIKSLVDKKQNSGVYEVTFDGSNLASGIYFCSLKIDNNYLKTIKMLLLK